MDEHFDRFIRDIKDAIDLYKIGVQDGERTILNIYMNDMWIAKKIRENEQKEKK
jgi:tRNA threonylcarbamoyladenosine modification (KEOPS) complex Cgi121 subunit